VGAQLPPVDKLRQGVAAFVELYNREWLIERLNHRPSGGLRPVACQPAAGRVIVSRSVQWTRPVQGGNMTERPYRWRLLLAVVGAFIFGCMDARLYLGRGAGFWVSNVSSVWLLLPFVAGAAATRTRRGAIGLGTTLTMSAFAAFYGWTVVHHAHQFTSRDVLFLLGGAVSGPLFGLLGRVWATHRSWVLGLPLVVAFVGEPYAWYRHVGRLPNPHVIWTVEVAVGIGLAGAFIVANRANRLRRPIRP